MIIREIASDNEVHIRHFIKRGSYSFDPWIKIHKIAVGIAEITVEIIDTVKTTVEILVIKSLVFCFIIVLFCGLLETLLSPM